MQSALDIALTYIAEYVEIESARAQVARCVAITSRFVECKANFVACW